MPLADVPLPLEEPNATALVLLAAGVLLAVSVLLSRMASRTGVPVALLFLVIGMLAGSDGFGGIWFDDYAMTFRFGTLALVLILFAGGLSTSWRAARAVLAPAVTLATVGVVGIAGLTAVGARLIGMPWPEALLFGAIVCSTDASAVFSVLQGSGLHVQRRAGLTLELESGLNDPVAVILTTAMGQHLLTGEPLGWGLLPMMGVQLLVGAGLGLACGFGGRWLLTRVHVSTRALYPVLTVGLALLAFSAPTLMWGSGFMAVYVAGIVLGNTRLPDHDALVHVHESIAWLAQVTMFLMLGLLVFPLQLPPVALTGTLLALFLAFVARPVVVAACLLPFGYTLKETLYIGWVGLRGAVPIILATLPLLSTAARASSAETQNALNMFNEVFFVVVVGALIPGATVPWVTRRLGLEERPADAAQAAPSPPVAPAAPTEKA